MMRPKPTALALRVAAVLFLVYPGLGAEPGRPSSLREAAAGLFTVGVGISDLIPERPTDWPLLTAQFSAVTPENCLKPNPVQVAEGKFNFARADAFVNFAAAQRLEVVGHCLVWAKDDRTRPWFYRDGTNTVGRELLLARMKAHIDAVAGRYRVRVAAWDVVNEALDDGTNFLRPSGWTAACGEEFLVKAFEYARAADPKALLIYNDYNNELPGKREKQIRGARFLLERKVPVHAIGLQGHYELDRIPFKEIEDTWRLVAVGLALQTVFGVLVLKSTPGPWFFEAVGGVGNGLLGFTAEGARFIFGSLIQSTVPVGTPQAGGGVDTAAGLVASTGAVFAFGVLPTIIFFSSLMSVLYHLGVMQLVVKGLAWVMQRTLRTSGAETLSASGNIFLGQTEAPLLIKPFVNTLTPSELFTVMVGGFATVAGGVLAAYTLMLQGVFPNIAGHLLAASVMNAPAGLLLSKMICPEVDVPVSRDSLHVATTSIFR